MLVLNACVLYCKARTYAPQSDMITATTVVSSSDRTVSKKMGLLTPLESILAFDNVIQYGRIFAGICTIDFVYEGLSSETVEQKG